MNKHYRLQQKGVALFQVLLITAIFSLLLLLMVSSVQQQQRQVQQLLDASKQQLAIYSAANTLSFALLTQDWLGPESGEQLYGWNFYNYPFDWKIPDSAEVFLEKPSETDKLVEVRLQDVNGLLDLRFPSDLHIRWLQYYNSKGQAARQLIDTLHKAQRPETAAGLPFIAPGLYLQHNSELSALPGWRFATDSTLLQATRVLGSEFNYFNAPDEILAALLVPAQFDIIRQWRQQGKVDRFRFSELTGIEPDEGATFFPGRELVVTLRTGTQQRQMHIRIEPNADTPVLLRQQYRAGW